ncbi:ABC transporter ATP-binding protein [Tenggerimyces flavus]|uniref:ABC transporter ATP-binding protein n=1 Tax=Tenggerimyces flavus TaxID=1708749 RepID=A0ABV7YMG0_9ACTN|nr:ABC transporter ATP-binding protein [Tenggerimyces flavus]
MTADAIDTTALGDPPTSVVLEVERLTVRYQEGDRTVEAVTDLSLSLRRGRTVVLIGESGCGKTTAALAILGMLPQTATIPSGRIRIDAGGRSVDMLSVPDAELRSLRWNHVAYVPQSSISAFNPIQRIGQHFRQTADAHRMARGAAEARASELLAAVHLDPHRVWHSYPHELSGGTRQRVAIALAMLLDPAVIILDEPTTALDVLTQDAVLRTLLELQESTGVSYLAITHDLAVAAALADDLVTMYAGRAVEVGQAADVLAEPLHPYTRGLLRSMPSVDSHAAAEPIGGYPPSMANLPPGCAFHPRCALAEQSCRSGPSPDLVRFAGRSVACPIVATAQGPGEGR